MAAQLLSFTATSMDADASDVVQTISFDSDHASFALMNEDGQLFRMWWRVGNAGEDECIMGLTGVTITDELVTIELDLQGALGYTGPYGRVEVRYVNPAWKPDIEDLFNQLLASQSDRLRVS
jgi:hypothetical protein